MSFDATTVSGAGFAMAVLRPYIGLRPNLRIGAGVRQFNRDAAVVVLIRNNSDGTSDREDYFVEEETISQTFVLAGLGFDYVHCAECSLVVGADIGSTFSFGDNQYLPGTRPSIGVHLGYYLTR